MKFPNIQEERKREKNEKINVIYQKNNYPKDIFKNKKFLLKTYGCQMNVHDSEIIKKYLTDLGFLETKNEKDADLILLNTCAIRENVYDKVYGFLGRCKHLKQEKKDLIIGICGCMAQSEKVCKTIYEKYKFVDIVFGTHNIYILPKLLIEKSNKLNIEVLSNDNNIYENFEYNRDSKYTAWVNIMYGCDKFCTYCIVPYTRGRQRSRKHEDIIKEVQDLIKKGYQEVTLLGQNVNAYGKDRENEIKFSELLQKVSDLKIPRIRFVTSHPWDFTDEMIDVIAKNDNIMPYIHLPLQSGSNKILQKMNRRYTKEEYLELFNKIKNKIKNVAITTDIIVGFPNESKEDFNDTLDIVKKCQFDSAFTFIFSKREGTPASVMPDKVSKEEKEQRLQKLNELINKFSLKKNKEYLNKICKVLVLGVSEKDQDKVYGYTETMKLVNIKAPKDIIGQIVDVKITDAKSFSLDGILKIDINRK